MDQHQEQDALKKAYLAQKSPMLTAYIAAYDGLNAERENLSSAAIYDMAYGIFGAFKEWLVDWEIESGLRMSDEEYAALWLMAATSGLTEKVAVDLLAERFAEDKHLILTSGFHVNWHSANYEAVVAGPGLTWVLAHPITSAASS